MTASLEDDAHGEQVLAVISLNFSFSQVDLRESYAFAAFDVVGYIQHADEADSYVYERQVVGFNIVVVADLQHGAESYPDVQVVHAP